MHASSTAGIEGLDHRSSAFGGVGEEPADVRRMAFGPSLSRRVPRVEIDVVGVVGDRPPMAVCHSFAFCTK